MKSIRGRLTRWFVAAFALVWGVAGATVYFSYRAGLLAGLEAELQNLCRQVRMAGMGGGGGPGRGGGPGWKRMEEPPDLGEGVYWQMWTPDGEELARSANLDGDLPRLGDGTSKEVLIGEESRMLASGRSFGMAHGGGPPWAGPGRGAVEITVAKPLAEVEKSLRDLLVLVGSSGLAALILSWLGIRLVVRDGLSPLQHIADEVGRLDATSLEGRFDEANLPAELRPIVERLNRLRERLDASFNRERRFSSDLAHEMRTPIAEARMVAESALKWPEEGGPEAWETVSASIARMEGVVQAMLQLARLEQQTPDDDGGEFPLRLLIEEVWQDQAELARERQLQLHLDLSENEMLSGDRALWSHLLANLLGNAAEYAESGSEVMVSLDGTANQESPVVIVANQASGITREDVDHFFDRFWRADHSRSGDRHCGLGLSLARACAEAMGQTLEAAYDEALARLEMRISIRKAPSPDTERAIPD